MTKFLDNLFSPTLVRLLLRDWMNDEPDYESIIQEEDWDLSAGICYLFGKNRLPFCEISFKNMEFFFDICRVSMEINPDVPLEKTFFFLLANTYDRAKESMRRKKLRHRIFEDKFWVRPQNLISWACDEGIQLPLQLPKIISCKKRLLKKSTSFAKRKAAFSKIEDLLREHTNIARLTVSQALELPQVKVHVQEYITCHKKGGSEDESFDYLKRRIGELSITTRDRGAPKKICEKNTRKKI